MGCFQQCEPWIYKYFYFKGLYYISRAPSFSLGHAQFTTVSFRTLSWQSNNVEDMFYCFINCLTLGDFFFQFSMHHKMKNKVSLEKFISSTLDWKKRFKGYRSVSYMPKNKNSILQVFYDEI